MPPSRGIVATRVCWGCATAMEVVGNKRAFECVWCEAINETNPRPRRLAMRRLGACQRFANRIVGRVAVACVSASAAYVGVCVIKYLAPSLCGNNLFAYAFVVKLALSLEFNLFFNYYHCVFKRAGVVDGVPAPARADLARPAPDRPLRKMERQPPRSLDAAMEEGVLDDNLNASVAHARGCFAGCTLCVPCGAAKPPHAHHCSACGACVAGMDHHCPFVNNCVGADNMRHFLLFCLYTALGAGYALAVAHACSMKNEASWASFADAATDKDAIRDGWNDANGATNGAASTAVVDGTSSAANVLLAIATWTLLLIPRLISAFAHALDVAFDSSPDWIGAYSFVVPVCGVVLCFSGLLFFTTFMAVASGESYIESLHRKRKGRRGRGRGREEEEEEEEGKEDGERGSDDDGGDGGDDGGDGGGCRGCVASALGAIGLRCLVDWGGLVAPWSEDGMHHLRQVFGSAHPAWWLVPRASPPPGARGSLPATKSE